MPVFTYKGTNRTGASVAGEMNANNKTELQSLLRRQQITPTRMSEKGKEFNLPTFGGGVKAKELAIFTRQFSVMIDAGLPLVQCLEILASQQENKIFQKVLDRHAQRRRRRQQPVHRHEAVSQGFRSALQQHGGSGRDRRYSRHHSPAPFHLHRKEREAQGRREVRLDLPDRRHQHCRGRHHAASLEGRSDFRHSVCGLGR